MSSTSLQALRWNGEKLPLEEEHELIRRYQNNPNDEEAFAILLENHIALIKSIVIKFKPSSAMIEDCLSEGLMGFINALKKFDTSKGTRLSTYATQWIRLYVQRFIDTHSSTIYVPLNKTLEIKKTLQSKGEEGLTEDMLDILKNRDLVSLDTPLKTDEDGKTLLDMISDDYITPEDYARSNLMHEEVVDVFDTLSPKESYIIRSYFGIGDDIEQKNFVSLSDELGISHQRVQQIYQRAIKKLREPPRLQMFMRIASDYGIINDSVLKTIEEESSKRTSKSMEVLWKKKEREYKPRIPSKASKSRYADSTKLTAKGTILPVISKIRPINTNKSSKSKVKKKK